MLTSFLTNYSLMYSCRFFVIFFLGLIASIVTSKVENSATTELPINAIKRQAPSNKIKLEEPLSNKLKLKREAASKNLDTINTLLSDLITKLREYRTKREASGKK